MLFHITTASAWDAATLAGIYRAPSLETEGFVHLSTAAQWPRTLQRWFPGRTDLVLLVLDERRLAAEVRYETAHGEDFPHLYGPLPIEAVIEIAPISIGADGLHRVEVREPVPA